MVIKEYGEIIHVLRYWSDGRIKIIKEMKKYLLPIIVALFVAISLKMLLYRLSFVTLDHEMRLWGTGLFFVIGLVSLIGWIFKRKLFLCYLGCCSLVGVGLYMYELYSTFPYRITANGVFFSEKGKFGFKDINGDVLIKPEFERVIPFSEFRKCGYSDGIGILYKDGEYFFAKTNGTIFSAERVQLDGTMIDEVEEQRNHMGALPFDWLGYNVSFIVPLENQFTIIDENGNYLFEHSFDNYIMHPTGGYMWIEFNDKWDIVELNEKLEVRNNKSFNEIQVMRDGVMAQLGNKAYYVYHDEGDVYFQKVEKENRYSYSNSNEEQKITIDAQLLLMLFMNQQMNNSQIRRMNQLYESQNIYSRDRETIEKEIAKFEKRKFEAEQRMGDGIAESMGYGQIVSRYNEMIEDRKRELRNIGN